VTLIGSNVPRWVLRHGSKGYLTDDCSDALQFCAHAKDARHFFAKRNAEKLANTYGLEVLDTPITSQPSALCEGGCMNDQKKLERQEQFRRLDNWLLDLHRNHKFYALLLAVGVAIVLAGLSWVLKVSLTWLAHLVSQ